MRKKLYALATLALTSTGVFAQTNFAKIETRYFDGINSAFTIDNKGFVFFDESSTDDVADIRIFDDLEAESPFKQVSIPSFHKTVTYTHYDKGGATGWIQLGDPNIEEDDAKGYYDMYIVNWQDYCPDGLATFSQTLFNQDENFEYVAPIYTTETVEYVKTYTKQSWTGDFITGFKIMTTDGAELQSVNFPAGYVDNGADCDVWVLNGNRYLSFRVEPMTAELGEYEYSPLGCYLLYKINGNSSVSYVKAQRHSARVFPTMASRSEVITVSFDSPTTQTCTVNMVNAQGRAVRSLRVDAGSESVNLSTDGLERGVYVVTVSDGADIRENCKVIIR